VTMLDLLTRLQELRGDFWCWRLSLNTETNTVIRNGTNKNVLLVQLRSVKEFMGWELIVNIK
jgi:hypothetical protein